MNVCVCEKVSEWVGEWVCKLVNVRELVCLCVFATVYVFTSERVNGVYVNAHVCGGGRGDRERVLTCMGD